MLDHGNNRRGAEQSRKRLVFAYLTTGTTSAGFEDYLLAQTDIERRLLHSRAPVDIEKFAEGTESTELSPPDVDNDEPWTPPMSLWAADAFDLWGTEVVACTVDSVLGALAFWRKSLTALPLWSQSAFIFDEVHAYGDTLFGALLEFLRAVTAPTLVMTASLSTARREAIERAVRESGRQVGTPITGKPEIETAERYELEPVEANPPDERDETGKAFGDDGRARRAIEEVLNRGERVLCVFNTVTAARAHYRELRSLAAGNRAWLYHSRFRYNDRVDRQKEVLDAFEADEPGFVCATQVCEMSLDISADLLVTEWAPFPALVQRMGRLNREKRDPEAAAPCLLVEPYDELPYAKESDEPPTPIDRARDRVAERLDGANSVVLSQADLADDIDQLEESEYQPTAMEFTHDRTTTAPGTLREISHGVTVILARHLEQIDDVTRSNLTKLEIPMGSVPRRYDKHEWDSCRGIPVVPDDCIDYCGEEGARWIR